MAGTLYVVGTPIGNLEDLSLRAARVLREADVIAAEDTRVGARRCSRTSTRSARSTPRGASCRTSRATRPSAPRSSSTRSRAGKRVAVISEAGMPGVSDPGARAVAAAIAAGARVEVIPGPTAALAALVGSGLPSDRFTFLGFPPREAGARRAAVRRAARRDRRR